MRPEHWVEFDLVAKGKSLPRLSGGCELHLIFFEFPMCCPLGTIQALWRAAIVGWNLPWKASEFVSEVLGSV